MPRNLPVLVCVLFAALPAQYSMPANSVTTLLLGP